MNRLTSILENMGLTVGEAECPQRLLVSISTEPAVEM